MANISLPPDVLAQLQTQGDLSNQDIISKLTSQEPAAPVASMPEVPVGQDTVLAPVGQDTVLAPPAPPAAPVPQESALSQIANMPTDPIEAKQRLGLMAGDPVKEIAAEKEQQAVEAQAEADIKKNEAVEAVKEVVQTEAAQKAVEPKLQDFVKAAEPVRQVAAQDAVVKEAAKAQARQAEEAQKKLEDQAEQNVQAQSAPESLPEFFNQGSFAQKLGAALAIIAGSVGSAVLRQQGNPALDVFKAEFEKNAAKRRFTAEQAAAAKEAGLKQLDMQLRQRIANSEVLKNNAGAQRALADIQGEIEKARVDQLKQLNLKSDEVNPDLLDPKDQERLISLPNGKLVLSKRGADGAKKVSEYMAETGRVVPEINELIEYVSKPDFSKLSLEDRRVVEAKLATLVGALRLPITGPGPMTDGEREFLLKTIGNPNKLFTLPALELASLRTVRDTINKRVKNAYQSFAGIQLPDSKRDKAVKYLTDRGMSEASAVKIVEDRLKYK